MKTRAHTRYKNSRGQIVPGATTVLGVLAKPALIPWANRLGLKGIDVGKFVDDKAMIGTLGHEMIECHLKGAECDTADYTENQIKQAKVCFQKYLDWENSNEIELIMSEVPLVSEKYQFGGTIDSLMNVNGTLTLVDFKTSKGIWPEHAYQLAAYRQLLSEHNHYPKECKILRIGRVEDEGFEVRTYKNLFNQLQIFIHALSIYKLKKE